MKIIISTIFFFLISIATPFSALAQDQATPINLIEKSKTTKSHREPINLLKERDERHHNNMLIQRAQIERELKYRELKAYIAEANSTILQVQNKIEAATQNVQNKLQLNEITDIEAEGYRAKIDVLQKDLEQFERTIAKIDTNF